jgi:hypothetical protein
MPNESPDGPDQEGRILQFRPRRRSRIAAFSNLSREQPPIGDLSRFAQGRDEDDYAHRMKVNAIAILFLAALVGGGIWIVDSLAQQRNIQDCTLSGRRNCAAGIIPTPLR